jgi:hypothetical protein
MPTAPLPRGAHRRPSLSMGRVTAYDPPHRVPFTWHPSREENMAQDVEVMFHPDRGGTRVELPSTGWEKLGKRASRERKGHVIGWDAVLSAFAGRRTASTVLFAILSAVITFALRITGKLDGMIDHAGGQISPTDPHIAFTTTAPIKAASPSQRRTR